jgi:DNA-binding response OmpR family regulator
MKVLIADDDPVISVLLTEGLRANGHSVVMARDAMQALMIAQKTQPDAVILDINMPAGSGVNALRHLKANSKTSSSPILVLTGVTDPELPATVLALGAVAFLSKPVSPEFLLAELARVVPRSS